MGSAYYVITYLGRGVSMSNWQLPELVDWEEAVLEAAQACYPAYFCAPRLCSPAWCYPNSCAPVIFK